MRLAILGLPTALSLWAVDVSGKWIAETPTRDGGVATVTMIFLAQRRFDVKRVTGR